MFINENSVRNELSKLCHKKELTKEDRAEILQIAAHTHRQVARAVDKEVVSDFLLERVQNLLYLIYRGNICSEISMLSEPIISVMSGIMWMLGLNKGRNVWEMKQFEAILEAVPMEEGELEKNWHHVDTSRLIELWEILVRVSKWETKENFRLFA